MDQDAAELRLHPRAHDRRARPRHQRRAPTANAPDVRPGAAEACAHVEIRACTRRRHGGAFSQAHRNSHSTRSVDRGYSQQAFPGGRSCAKTVLRVLAIAVVLSPAVAFTQGGKAKPTTAT